MTEDTKEAPQGGGSLALPPRFGPYVVEKALARGGMGAILLVRHEKLGAPYALKVIPDAYLDSNALIRFRREIEALSALSGHPHIVGVHACGVQDGRPWYVMDRIEGESLDKLLVDRPLSIRAALRLGVHLASALEAAHARGVLHRDMKPSNVLVVGDLETTEGRAVLLDFGLATQAGAALTKTGEVLGTPAFLAPEQALGERERLGPHTDVFGLAAVLYYALTRERAFGRNATSTVSALAAVLNDKLRPPRRLRPEIPEAFERVLVRALEKDPADRYGSAADMKRDLEAILRGGAKPAARRGGAAPVVLGVLLLLGAAAAVAASLVLLARKPGPSVAPPPAPVASAVAPSPGAPAPPAPIAAPRPGPATPSESVADSLRAARELLAKKPVEAVKRAIGGRITEDPREREQLAAFAIEAAGPESRDAEPAGADRLALVAQEAAKAGLDVAPLVSRIDALLEVALIPGTSVKTRGDAFDRMRRLELAACSLRKRTLVDEAAESLGVLERPPHCDSPIEDRVDQGGPYNWADDAPRRAELSRLLARRRDLPLAARVLEEARAAGEDPERIELARIELLLASNHPLEAWEQLGPPPPDESLARRLLRAHAIEHTAFGTRAPEHRRAALEAWERIFDEAVSKLREPRQHYVATRASLALIEVELGFGRLHAARARFARGRIALGGGGRDFTEFWWGQLFRDP